MEVILQEIAQSLRRIAEGIEKHNDEINQLNTTLHDHLTATEPPLFTKCPIREKEKGATA